MKQTRYPHSNHNHYQTDYEIGQDNIEIWGMDIHHPVFFISATLILLFVSASLLFPEIANSWLNTAKTWCIDHFDWFFMSSASLVLIFCIALMLLPLGKIRLGGDAAKPEFSRLSWFAMLFAAGMGIGLMFWSVAEPIAYYTGWGGTPLNLPPFSARAADMALPATLYHWGLHAWAIYAVVGLSLAFFCYNKGLPLTVRSAFYPILGDRIWGWWGHIIDITAVLATIFGLATSLGFGANQATSGLHFLFGVANSLQTKIIIVCGVTFFAVLSVVRGLEGGVRILSNINISLAAGLLLLVFIVGPTVHILQGMLITGEEYLVNLVPLSNWIDRPDEQWMHGWSVFYWAWWVSWSPFVGMFIARISKGRTVREFLFAVLIVPTLVTLVWMSVFGISALEQSQEGVGQLAKGIDKVSLSTFHLLEHLPWTSFTSLLAVVLVIVFFITSSDSGSLVIDSITSGGKLDAPVPQRIFWAVMEGMIALVLLVGGGKAALGALQAGAITTGLPFTLVLLVMVVSLSKGLLSERPLLRRR
ncbi:BCCT family transporter [Halioxenophilus sp. WMMB6]|uniref:BCCT family transporter n=1 Tax=Halioxenophilus sp. WMMB6 TaxID=3073815 RepID=UPI00295E6C62|nr:BCCT family transporter [Halioxenophilus sp. WMMB6]